MADNRSDAELTIRDAKSRYLLKLTHVLFSIMLTLFGTGLLITTIAVRYQLSEYSSFLHYYFGTPVVVIVIVSMLVIALGCLGILSSLQNWIYGIITFGVLLFGLFMFMLTMVGVSFAVAGAADNAIYSALEEEFEKYGTYNSTFDNLQISLSCCGINDFTDWNNTLGEIPGSCCSSDSACGFNQIVSLNLTGCYAALQALINYCILVLGIALITLALLQVTSITLSFFFGRSLVDRQRRIREAAIQDLQDLQIPRLQSNVAQSKNKVEGEMRKTPLKNQRIHPEGFQYVRHPVQQDVILNYRSPHENFLSAAPQIRFDRRYGRLK